ncbi:hypothetical protein [Roseisolibacter agri]|uniref:Uncharacterized protein n=1 Tax=Roseisolibacter agri TaxID=2014610 RepID=A0AA37V553_9BACT|nr:hypothetical protein [Roseisolibacter agri]GLC23681.1 hypothetical protein rosag_01940 [Roseisolibacter agri]
MQSRTLLFAAVSLTALVAVAACASDTEPAATPVAPTEPAGPAFSAAPAGPNVAAALGNRIASTCRGYARKQAALQAAIGKAKGDEEKELREQLAALEVIKKDACD